MPARDEEEETYEIKSALFYDEIVNPSDIETRLPTTAAQTQDPPASQPSSTSRGHRTAASEKPSKHQKRSDTKSTEHSAKKKDKSIKASPKATTPQTTPTPLQTSPRETETTASSTTTQTWDLSWAKQIRLAAKQRFTYILEETWNHTRDWAARCAR
jgi:hypothetical protein